MMEDTAGPLEEWDDRAQHLAPLPKRDISFWQRKELNWFFIIPALGHFSAVQVTRSSYAQLFLAGQLEIKSWIYDNAKWRIK